jgi:hypothetical protein
MRRVPIVLVQLAAIAGLVHAQSGARPKRMVSEKAPPPKWTAAERAAFFANAAEQLGPEPVASVTPENNASPATSASASNDGSKFAWSRLISPDELESEVKSLALLLSPAVKSPNDFKGGGFKTSRREFTNLAAMFGIAAEYDDDVRWKTQAAALRDALGRAGKNCKVGTDGTYAEAKRRADELAELVRGGNPALDAGSAESAWSEHVDRPPLMERMEIARTERLKPWTGGKNDFTAHREEIIHEAQIVAALAEIISHPGYDYAEDESYLDYVKQLQASAVSAAEAAKQNDFPATQAAISTLGQSCDKCHGDYR